MDMQSALETYFTESKELLEDMESQLLLLETEECPDPQDAINAIFRAAHTIKGSAGLFELNNIVHFTHDAENVLDRLRDGDIALDSTLISILFECKDVMLMLVEEAEEGVEQSAQSAAQSEALTVQLKSYLGEGNNPEEEGNSQEKHETGSEADLSEDSIEHDHWHLVIEFSINSFRDGMDPMSFLSFLSTLGDIVQIQPILSRFPDEQEFDPESCYLAFEIELQSQATRQQIEDVFEFIREESQLHIIPPRSELSHYITLIKSMPDSDLKLGEILVNCGALTYNEVDALLDKQSKVAEETKPIGEIVVEEHSSLKKVVDTAVNTQQKVRSKISNEQKSLRVDADKLDTLINLIGELVTSGAGTALHAETSGNENVIESVASLNLLLEEVRDAALNLRMVAIGGTFGKFQRVVRDVSKELHKDVKLVINGADTELDKSVIEKVGDPLTHLVRNALDHGLESPEERVEKGKPRTGHLTLNAYHDSGNIVIEVKDDGKGLNANALKNKAIEKELIHEDAVLSDQEAFNLIFLPGFSTAASVSNISGRGVGMDVVKRNINELRGRIAIDSEVDKGTTIKIMLPLTLAIIDGFAIQVGDETFVVPLDMVKECIELDHKHDATQQYFNLRGEVLPLIFLKEQFQIESDCSTRQNIVVIQTGKQCAGIVVDHLQGELQTVIKPLGRIFSKISGISGSTILGNGNVALILDVPGLIQALLESNKHYITQ